MKQCADKKTSMIVCNISSVICPHELISSPFVFSETDANQTCFLHPNELAKFVVQQADEAKAKGGFVEVEKFKENPNFDPDHYTDEKFTPRKVRELYG
jgi:hypothetical protein